MRVECTKSELLSSQSLHSWVETKVPLVLVTQTEKSRKLPSVQTSCHVVGGDEETAWLYNKTVGLQTPKMQYLLKEKLCEQFEPTTHLHSRAKETAV